jgi:methylated-DNA-[protein]-cysteine S-methyltransferase
MTAYYTTTASPIGSLLLVGDGESITVLDMEPHDPTLVVAARPDDGPFRQAVDQLAAYFAGARTDFELPLAPRGTEFQRRVWQALRSIPYGHTTSYGELATLVGNPNASRAVGLANGRNPIAIVVPCHRVIGRDGRLTGYGGGLDRKRWLLDHEASVLHRHGLQPSPAAAGALW